MALDPDIFAQIALSLGTDMIEHLGEVFERDVDDLELGIVGVVAEVRTNDGGEHGFGTTLIVARTTETRSWVQAALFQAASKGILGGDED